jgi:hypothetical protein
MSRVFRGYQKENAPNALFFGKKYFKKLGGSKYLPAVLPKTLLIASLSISQQWVLRPCTMQGSGRSTTPSARVAAQACRHALLCIFELYIVILLEKVGA